MKYHFLLFILICAFSLNGLAESKITYFRHIDIGSCFNEIRTKDLIDEFTSKFTKCYRVTYDNENRIQDVLFLDKGKPVFDDFSICDLKIEHQNGLEKRTLLNSDGQIVPDLQGISVYELKLNDKNYPTQLSYYDNKGNPVEDKNGIAILEWQLDSLGRKITESYRNLKGKQITNGKGAYETKFKWGMGKYDFREMSYWSEDGDLLNLPGIPSIYLSKYNTQGLLIESRYLGTNNQLIADKEGIAIYRLKYDPEDKKVIERSFFGVDDQLIETKKGFAILTFKYDKLGNQIEECIFGANGKPKEIEGTATYKTEYDLSGYPIKYSYFGSDGFLKDNLKTGISATAIKYDEQKNITEIRVSGMDGKLKERLDNKFAIYRYKYDSIGNKIENSNYGKDEKLKADSKGVAIVRWKYDKEGDKIEESHYGVNYLLLNKEKEISIIRFKYSKKGQLLLTTYLDSNEKIIDEVNNN